MAIFHFIFYCYDIFNLVYSIYIFIKKKVAISTFGQSEFVSLLEKDIVDERVLYRITPKKILKLTLDQLVGKLNPPSVKRQSVANPRLITCQFWLIQLTLIYMYSVHTWQWYDIEAVGQLGPIVLPYTLLERWTDDAKILTISLYFTQLYVT